MQHMHKSKCEMSKIMLTYYQSETVTFKCSLAYTVCFYMYI